VNCLLRKIVLSVIALGVGLSLPAVVSGTNPSHGAVSLTETAEQVTLANDYLKLAFDRESQRILFLSADHAGSRNFFKNLLGPSGIRFSDVPAGGTSRVETLARTPAMISVRIAWTPTHSSLTNTVQLTLSLGAADRGVHIQCLFSATESGVQEPSVHISLHQWFLLGIFNRGVVQYVAGQRQMFTSHDRLRLFYTLDRENGSVAIEPNEPTDLAETVLLSGDTDDSTGIELRAQQSGRPTDVWKSFSTPLLPRIHSCPKQTIDFQLFANDLPFPAHRGENGIDGDEEVRRDSTAYFTAVYGSGVGVLGSYAEPGSAYPTLATPDRPYGDAFDFFDPDAWSTVTALSYSGDTLLQQQARRVLERSENFLLPDGQVPHHFDSGAPIYISLAKSSQTGPNIFWVIAASEYAAGTGDESWLRAHYAHMQLATNWILGKYDPTHRLLRADGPLFIDVFRRSGYTLDTNVAALYLLDRMADVAEFCGDPKSAALYRTRRRDLYLGIRAELWDGHDHFITQKNPDGSKRDFVDYDGNYAALALGVADVPQAAKLLQRLDAGPHAHPKMYGTWVSERRYEPEECYGGNDGDSDTAMARIWWFDMATRVRMGDHSTFDALLNTVESYLLREVWMPERYDAAGLPTHNGYYHEYPDIETMVLREMRYGIRLGFREVTVHPFGVTNFDLRLGRLQVAYSPSAVSIFVPGSRTSQFVVSGLVPHANYKLSGGKSISTDAEGTLSFRAPAGKAVQILREPAR
jgi:hypothetical protein